MAIAMVAMLAFGGTYAYFTAQAGDVTSGKITMGYIKVSAAAADTFTTAATKVLPGDTVLAGGVTITNEGSDSATDWIAVRISFTGSDKVKTLLSIDDATDLGTGWETTGTEGIFMSSAAVSSIELFKAGFTIPADTTDDHWNGTTSTNELMGAEITIKIETRSVQGKNLTDKATAKTELLALFA